MRVTDQMKMASLRESQSSATERLYNASQRASSGLKVSRPADDPAAFARIASKNGTLAKLTGRQQGLDRTQGDLSVAESALANGADIMAQARELAVELSDGSVDPATRAAAAKQVTELRQALVGIANTRGASGYVFSGTATDTPAIAANGAFQGNDNAIQVELADGVLVRGNPSGAKAFTAAGGRDVLQDLSDFATALSANDVTGLQAMVQKLSDGQKQVTAARADAGVELDRIRTASTVTSTLASAVKETKASDEEMDPTTAYTDLAAANDAYNRSLEVARRILATFSVDKMP
jgi:flagellar hook-associated protein 3 FlgL